MSTTSPTPTALKKNRNGFGRCRSGAIVFENCGVGDGERQIGGHCLGLFLCICAEEKRGNIFL